jgi:hypothetical protein
MEDKITIEVLKINSSKVSLSVKTEGDMDTGAKFSQKIANAIKIIVGHEFGSFNYLEFFNSVPTDKTKIKIQNIISEEQIPERLEALEDAVEEFSQQVLISFAIDDESNVMRAASKLLNIKYELGFLDEDDFEMYSKIHNLTEDEPEEYVNEMNHFNQMLPIPKPFALCEICGEESPLPDFSFINNVECEECSKIKYN